MRRTNIIAETMPYKSRHVYVDYVNRIKALAIKADCTQEEILNDALDFGLECLEAKYEED